MRPIRVLPVGSVEQGLLDPVVSALALELRTSCTLANETLDPLFAHHPERNQYHSTAIIDHLSRLARPSEVLVGITDLDLYIPILTFVFGEAQLGGSSAVVSYHRLSQEFYGLPADGTLLSDRLVKEAIHEVGHTTGLTHCDDYECVMAASYSVEWLDVKGVELCTACRTKTGC